MDGRAIEVSYLNGFSRRIVAQCAVGHVWTVEEDEVEAMRERLSIASYHKAENVMRLIHAKPEVLECPECAAMARAGQMSAFDDPDYLRIPGGAE